MFTGLHLHLPQARHYCLYNKCHRNVGTCFRLFSSFNPIHLLLVILLLYTHLVTAEGSQVKYNNLLGDFSISDINQLGKYELLTISSIKHKLVKRGTGSQIDDHHKFDRLREVKFTAFGREFRLILNEKPNLVSPRFKVYVVNAQGEKRPYGLLDRTEFYEGRLFGSTKSRVSAHIDSENGFLTATINDHDNNQVYIIEPSWRHLNGSQRSLDGNTDSLIYRESDVKHSSNSIPSTSDNSKKSTFCDYVKIDDYVPTNESIANRAYELQISRSKRRAAFGSSSVLLDGQAHQYLETRCTLLLVADFLFYKNMGGEDTKQTINYLISLVDRVNTMFMATDWSETPDEVPMNSMGFVVHEIIVHDEPNHEQEHYNNDERIWKVRDLLETFSHNQEFDRICLAHLFTHRKFDNAVLGLAYVASARPHSYGGICSSGYTKNGQTLYYNTGLTTTRNTFGQPIITRVADLVTAHELGHNWGAEHDPDNRDCSPPSRTGGAYIMYTYSVGGYDVNNKLFSPCSRRSVKAVLLAKARTCFTKVAKAFCGNGIVENGEECDAGQIGQTDRDPCCDSDCLLKPGADCSDRNSVCCSGCRRKPAGVLCREENPLSCKKESYCPGTSYDCPDATPVENGQDCLDNGKCKDGNCLPYCETIGMHSCMCDDTKGNYCRRCCRRSIYQNSSCEPVNPVQVLGDGTPCLFGFCEKGRCEKSVQDIVQRFWDVIEEIDGNTFLKFLKDNIVGVVIVITALIWIPVCLLVERYDRGKRKKIEGATTLQRKYNAQRPSAQRPSNSSERSTVTSNSANLTPSQRPRNEFGNQLPRNPNHSRARIVRPSPRAMNGAGYQHTTSHNYNLRLRPLLDTGRDVTSDDEGGFTGVQRNCLRESNPCIIYPNSSVTYNARRGVNSQPHVYAEAVRSSHVAYYDQDEIDDNPVVRLESGSSARSSDRSIQI